MKMKPRIFSTRTTAPADQLEAWRNWFSPVFQINPVQTQGDFIAENKVWNLDGILVSRVSAPAVRVVRSKSDVSRAPIDHWALTYCSSGTTCIRTRKSEINAVAGVPFVWSLGEASESFRSQVDRIQLLLPRDAFPDVAMRLDAAKGSVLDNPMGRLLGDYLLVLESHLPSVSDEDLPKLSRAVRTMVAACIAPSADRIAMAEESIAAGSLERVRQVVHANLRSPALTPDGLAKLAGMSRSQLYRVLEYHGGVANYIKRQRLSLAYSQLADPANQKSVSTIAEGLCFGDAASFSRAFRREFGCTPNDVRASVARGNTLVARRSGRHGAQPLRFSDLFN